MKQLLPALFLFFTTTLFFTNCKKDNPIVLQPPLAVAGSAQTIQIPVDSVLLIGSGKSTGSKIVGYLWSEVSGPNVPVIASESSPTTIVRGMIPGTYIFQFLVIDSLGLSGVDTLSVFVNPAPVDTLTLQPANNINETILAGNATDNFSNPNATEIAAGTWTQNSILDIIRGAFQFDLSGIPANATILSAKLTLYSNPIPLNGDLVHANSGPSNQMYIQRINSSWNSSVTFQNQPSVDTTGEILIPQTNLPFLDLTDVDVTNLVTKMYTTTNYGFMIRLQDEVIYNDRDFCSSKNADATKHPKLVVVYQQQ
jgi:K319-like protein